MDNDVINVSMYPSGYTPSTETGEVSDQAMTRSGIGKPINEEMIEDYACGDEPGHYFISSPLNVYALARDSSVVLYVEGGCANFTWASDNAWATFSSATTSVRYNTLTSSADEGQDTVVTVTDSNGLEVTINVPYMDASTCCEDVPTALAFQTPIDELIDIWPGQAEVFIDGGCPPFTWRATPSGFYWREYPTTNSRRNKLYRETSDNPEYVRVTDHCGTVVTMRPLCFPAVADYNEMFSTNQRCAVCHINSEESSALGAYALRGDGVVGTFTISSEGVASDTGESHDLDTGNADWRDASPTMVVLAYDNDSYAVIGYTWLEKTWNAVDGYIYNQKFGTSVINKATGELSGHDVVIVDSSVNATCITLWKQSNGVVTVAYVTDAPSTLYKGYNVAADGSISVGGYSGFIIDGVASSVNGVRMTDSVFVAAYEDPAGDYYVASYSTAGGQVDSVEQTHGNGFLPAVVKVPEYSGYGIYVEYAGYDSAWYEYKRTYSMDVDGDNITEQYSDATSSSVHATSCCHVHDDCFASVFDWTSTSMTGFRIDSALQPSIIGSVTIGNNSCSAAILEGFVIGDEWYCMYEYVDNVGGQAGVGITHFTCDSDWEGPSV